MERRLAAVGGGRRVVLVGGLGLGGVGLGRVGLGVVGLGRVGLVVGVGVGGGVGLVVAGVGAGIRDNNNGGELVLADVLLNDLHHVMDIGGDDGGDLLLDDLGLHIDLVDLLRHRDLLHHHLRLHPRLHHLQRRRGRLGDPQRVDVVDRHHRRRRTH
ncbi:hypothetical protein LPJ72_004805, partial [Coemansia sp. Benny D160-2]